MSNELIINCPNCLESFALTEALAGPLLEVERSRTLAAANAAVESERMGIAAAARKAAEMEFATKILARDEAIAARDSQLKQAQQAELAARKAVEEAERAQQNVELTIQRRVDEARVGIAAEATRIASLELSGKLAAAEAAIVDRDALLLSAQQAELEARKAREAAEQAKQQIELDVQRRVDAMCGEVAETAAAAAKAEFTAQLTAAQSSLADKDLKLVAAQSAEIEARRLKGEAEEAKRETELMVARRLDDERNKVRDQAYRERDEEYRLKIGDKDAQLRSMQEQIEELRRRGAQTSQQLVGEVLEANLIEVLEDAFPSDRFERTRKGQRGADVLQTVLSASGLPCGSILWESKRTKTWIEPWLAKLREDQRDAKADIAALATETLPEGVTTFTQREGVWVTSLSSVIPVALALRHALNEVHNTRRAGAMADSAKDHVFAYLTSPQFRQRITRITETYSDMRAELDKEKRSALTQFSKREKQLERILCGITGFYGDLQGIVGSSLPPVEGLMLEAPLDDGETRNVALKSSAAPLVLTEDAQLLS